MKQQGMKRFKKFKLGEKYYDDYDLAEMCKMHATFMKTRVESGHTKGVILGDKFTSLWLVHSVPRFPPIPDRKFSLIKCSSESVILVSIQPANLTHCWA